MEKVYLMNKETYKGFYKVMKKEIDVSENPLEAIERFYNIKVLIDDNLNNGRIEVYDYDFYSELLSENDVELKYAKLLGVDELE